MSQVKKLQAGGKFIIDGQEINGTDAINAVRSNLGETTGGIMRALQDGATVKYNSADNSISIVGNNGNSQTLNYLPAGAKADLTDSKFKRNIGATFHTTTDQFRRDLLRLRNVAIPKAKPVDNTANLTNLRKGSGWFYTKDANGKDIFEEGPLNKDRFAMLNEFRDYIQHYGDFGEEESKKKYNTSGWNADNLRILQNTFASIKDPSARDEYWTGLLGRIKANQLSNVDKETLRLMGFDDATATENSSTGITPADRTKWGNAGFGGLVDLLGNKAHINDDGSLSLNDGESWGWNLGDLSGRNIYFNDNFYQSEYGASGAFDPFRGLTLYNNRLYTLNNPTLARILNAENGFNTLKDAGDWEGADNIILTRFTDAARENPGEFRDDRYSEFLSDHPEYRFTNLTGLYDIEGLNPGEQLIQLYNLDTPLQNNSPYREYAPRYVVLDNKGKWLRDYDNFAGRKIRGASAKDLITYNRVTPEMGGNSAYAGRYYEDILGKNNEPTGYRVYYNPQNPDEDMILHMPGINAMGVEEDQDIKVPVELGKILIKKFQDKDFLERLIGNAQNKKDFQRFMSELVQSWFRQDSNNDFARLTWTLPFTETNRKKWKDLGFKGNELDEVIAAWKNAKRNRTSGNREERRYKYLVTSPNIPQEKNGGVIKKFQFGGVAGGSTNVKADTTKRVDVKNTNPKNSYTIGSGKENWTQADSLELGALIGDLGSLATAFVPGANIASAATGAAASTARFVADKQRDTKGAGLNYLLNLGMDAATLLPIIGGGVKSLGVVKSVKKALPTIIKAASVYGLGSAVVNSANKIAKGDDWTLRDISIVLNALTAGVGLSKQGGLGKSTKTTKTKGYSESFKVGETEVTLNNKQITDIMESSNQTEALTNAIKAQAKNASKEEINAALDKLLKSKQSIWQRIRGKEGEVVLNVKKKPNTSVEQLEAIEGRPLYNWWHGLGDNRAAYNARIVGDKKAWGKANLIKTTGGQKSTQMYWDGKSWHPVKQSTKEVPIAGTETFSSDWATGSGPIWPTQQITRTILNPTVSVRTVTRGKGVKLDKNRYNLYDSQRIYVPQLINPFTKANYQSNVDKQPSGFVYQSSYKKGGKIIKAQDGLYLGGSVLTRDLKIPLLYANNNITFSDLKTLMENEQNNVIKNAETSVLNAKETLNPLTQTVVDNSGIERTYDGSSIRDAYIENKYQAPTSVKYNNEEVIKGLQPGSGLGVNLPNLDDTLRAAVTARYIYKDRDLQRMANNELFKRQFQAPQFNVPRLDISDIEQSFNEAMKPYLESNFVTSDSRDSMGFKLSKAQQISNLTGQKNAQIDQKLNQFREIKRQIDDKNESIRKEIANQRSQYITGLKYQNRMLDSVALNRLFSDVVVPFGQQMSQQGRDAWNRNAQLNYQIYARQAADEENARITEAFKTQYGDAWDKLSDKDKARYGSLEDYVYSVDPEFWKNTRKPSLEYNMGMQLANKAYNNIAGAGIFYKPLEYFKSGGTINIKNTNKNQRSAQEQIAINGAKSAKRSVDELSKALLRMLQQLTK